MSHDQNPNRAEVPVEPTGPDAPPAKEESTELIGGKFKSHDDLLAAYQELESKLGQKGDEPKGDAPSPDDTPKDEPKSDLPPDPQRDAVNGILEKAGLSLDGFEAEYTKDGQLSEASYQALAEKGFSKALVDQFIGERVASLEKVEAATEIITQAQIDAVKAPVGGDEGYSQMMQWAAQNLTDSQKAAYDAVMESGDLGQIELAVAGLHAKYSASVGMEPSLVGGRATGSDAGDVFRSTAEVVKAMSDPRYRNDPAYIAEVEAKVKRSNIF